MTAQTTAHPRSTRHRTRMREAGMRPIQLWVPDTKLPAFAEECRRQSLLAAKADMKDAELMSFMDGVLDDLGDMAT